MHSECIIIIHLDQLYVLTQSYMQIIVKVSVNGYIKLVILQYNTLQHVISLMHYHVF